MGLCGRCTVHTVCTVLEFTEGLCGRSTVNTVLYHREQILKTSTLSCNEEEEEITKPPTR
jgi:hypothetical protein